MKMYNYKVVKRHNSVMGELVESLVQMREKVQKKTFTRWCNMHLTKEQHISDLFEDLRTGQNLLRLINALSQQELKPERGKTEIHHRQNVNRALDALSRIDPHHGISTSSIVEGVPKLTLALIWHLVLKYSHLQNMSSGVSAESYCRQWCSETVAGYAGLEHINSDFVGTFLTGLTLAAIIHRHRNELIDYLELYHTHSPAQRFAVCFTVAEEWLEVPQLLDVEDMERGCVDEQSILTYVMSLNKVLGSKPPSLVPHLAQLSEQEYGLEVVREELSDEELTPVDTLLSHEIDVLLDHERPELMLESDIQLEETGLDEMGLEETGLEEEIDLTVDEGVSGMLSASPDNLPTSPSTPDDTPISPSTPDGGPISPVKGFIEEDKDSGLDSDTSPRDDKLGSDNDDNETVTSDTSNTATALHHDQLGSNLTLDSEEYISAASSPTVLRRQFPELLSPDTEDESYDITYFEESLKHIATIPESVPVTVSDLQQMIDLLSSKRDECLATQRLINLQLNNNQDRETRAQLHQLLKESGHFDEILLSSCNEVMNLMAALGPFNEAVHHCTEFAASTEDTLDETPHTVQGAQHKLTSHRKMRALLEDEQRNLEHAHRALVNNTPKNIPVSLHEQQRLVTEIQNHLSDIEAVLTGSVESLDFLCTRLPQLEDKLHKVDIILTDVEQGIEEEGEGQELKTQLERARMHLNTVENLFTAIEMFSGDFDLTLLRRDWLELGERCNTTAEEVKFLIASEEHLSDEVVEISDWADTLEQFLSLKIKPAQSRKQLREIQAKWKDVWDDLRSKVAEIDVMLDEEYSTSDQRTMSPLDCNTLQRIRDQLTSLYDPVKGRRETLQEAYISWGVVVTEMKSVGRGLKKFGAVVRVDVRGVRPLLGHIVDLCDIEQRLRAHAVQLQSLHSIISELPSGVIDNVSVGNEKLVLTEHYTALCRGVSQQRAKSQHAALDLVKVVPFLRTEHRERLRWLYEEPFIDLELSRDETSVQLMSNALERTDISDVPSRDYWHVIKTVAPEKLPLLLFTWIFYAVAPFGIGCSIDLPLRISEYQPDIRI